MELVESIKLALQRAAEERNKVATFHSLVLINADRLKHLDAHEFCKNVGVTDTFHIEFKKMIATAQILSQLGYSIQKR
jgi:hypothetical protein